MVLASFLKIWPSPANPAWGSAAAAAAVLGPALAVAVAPRAVLRKLNAAAMAPLKNRFLVDGLGDLPSKAICEHYTYLDMTDVARHGDDVAATRLHRWLVASCEAGRPVTARGQVIDSVELATAYCQRNLALFRSLQQNGYSYTGRDEICLGITADGALLHMRRGTHRMAAAHMLAMPRITARITHVDRRFAADALRAGERGGAIASLAKAIQEVTRQTLA
ncbi:hypothetical protein A8950_2537 [Dongia mobilis]|uniref:Uncharacterized protein n=1 Tax=Dongia mobilis TaxID=578943 RepID=A0A4R6WPQ9_9PROT|nr:hypothetical protein [Dongia mobilis]TDQ81469.1 hypothetical protein A8950_2537 [Dongia mobilis]